MATPTTSDFLVVPINGTDLIAFFRGSNISRPLYLRYSTFLDILSQSIGGGTTLLLQTNSVDNQSQALLNLIQGSGITITDNGSGGITIAATGGASFITSISDTADIDLDVTASDLSATLTTTGVTPNTYGSSTQVPQITVDSKGRITGVTLVNITAGTGSVTSVATAGLISGGPITVSGTITTSMNTNKLVGRGTAGTGIMEEITVGSGLTLTGAGVLNNTATPTPLGYYGAFSDVTDQFATVINTGYPMLLGVTDLSNGVTVVSGSRVTIANTGIYNIQWSAQFRNPAASEHDVTIWLRKNGVDVPGSAGVVLVPAKHGSSDGHTLPSWNFLLDVVAGDYYEFVWSTDDLAVFISFQPAGSPPPSTASVILTVTQQSGILAGTGITAINSLTGAVQTLTNGTSGLAPAFSSVGTTHTLNIPLASTASVTAGLISNADYTTFNNKVATTRAINTTAPLTGGGDLSADRTIAMPQATSSVDGYLSSTDWFTFNSKAFIYKSVIDGISTSTANNTLSQSQLIPGGTFVAGNIIRVFCKMRATGVGAAKTYRIYVNTTNDLLGTPVLLATVVTGANALFSGIKRDFAIKSATNTEMIATAVSINTDDSNSNSLNSINIDWSTNKYIIFAVQRGSAADTLTSSSYSIERL
jgi:hypothetical protein